jgi:hypothetical protein
VVCGGVGGSLTTTTTTTTTTTSTTTAFVKRTLIFEYPGFISIDPQFVVNTQNKYIRWGRNNLYYDNTFANF